MTDFGEQLQQLVRDSRKALREDVELADSMRILLANKHFNVYLTKVIGQRIEEYGKMLLDPSGSVDGMVKSEFVKGAMSAFCLARDLPSVIVASMSDTRESQETQDGPA